ncbi:metallophosphoesterase [Marinospirillum alkaliphilum]|uniref:Icc protein n=1 Tax=Marinospirillum alkaliphilum DSM 21637 TaxID=1122209 RepID=A0A1K1YF33_9GAMM|nr:metallophosphoesterase [Marinospirillum alkaliphilum]SFX60350.1 Icc protein [Marinospirillum alkaliphilum DSM 21637]
MSLLNPITESGVFRLVQLTDPHLLADPTARYRGLDTRQRFLAGLQLARRLQPDLLLLTGDLAQDEAAATYQWLYQQLQASGLTWRWLPGNHDAPELMQAWSSSVFHDQTPHWQLLGLDSHWPGQVAGYLSATELERLQQALTDPRPLLVALHHPPIKVNSRWMDAISLDNASNFWQLVDKLDLKQQLKLLICGHVHQPLSRQQGHTRVLACPSTAAQFTPQQDEFSIDDKALPALRLIRLNTRGCFSSRLIHYDPQAVTHSSSGQGCG